MKASPQRLIPDDSGSTGETGAGSGDDGSDGGDGGVDEDGDGVTVEDGDCDDTDYQRNPNYPEDITDGKDNDCDGRVDELWGGFAYAEQYGLGSSSIVVVSSVEVEDYRLTVPDSAVPWSVTQGGDADWYTATYPYFVDLAGPMSFVSSGLIPYPDDSVPGTSRPPSTGCRSRARAACSRRSPMRTTTDASLWATTTPSESVWVSSSRACTSTGRWYVTSRGTRMAGLPCCCRGSCSGWTPTAPPPSSQRGVGTIWRKSTSTSLYGAGIDVDPATGTIGIAGLLGGFATWNADTGLEMAKAMDLSGDIDFDSLYQTVGLTWMDGDGWYTMSAVFTSGQYAVRRWQPDGLEWSTEVNWNDEFIQPLGITTNGDQGDWIVSSKGGQYRVVFRVRGADRSTDDLVSIPEEWYNIWGVANRY